MRFVSVILVVVAGAAITLALHRFAWPDVAAVLGALCLVLTYHAVIAITVNEVVDWDRERLEQYMDPIRRFYLVEAFLAGLWIGLTGRAILMDVLLYLFLVAWICSLHGWSRDFSDAVAAGRPLPPVRFEPMKLDWEHLLVRYATPVLISTLLGLVLRIGVPRTLEGF